MFVEEIHPEANLAEEGKMEEDTDETRNQNNLNHIYKHYTLHPILRRRKIHHSKMYNHFDKFLEIKEVKQAEEVIGAVKVEEMEENLA